MKQISHSQRQSRTRTLIQLGGLLSLSGLPRLFDIQEGDDLQGDLLTRDKAAALLGLLAHTMETWNTQTDLSQWQQKGQRFLKPQG